MEGNEMSMSFDFKTVEEYSKEWGISKRRIIDFCKDGRIKGAFKKGRMWFIPNDISRPEDARTREYYSDDAHVIKPFIKWAGGKGQILDEIRNFYPPDLGKSINKYAEPFIGGGAVLFDILSRYDIKEVYISDINRELTNTYHVVKNNLENLISLLNDYQKTHLNKDSEERKEYFYEQRDLFNVLKSTKYEYGSVEIAALFIYLNKTCFNGLYRVNSRGLFNTPSGVYTNPKICDEKNLRAVSEKLKNVTIVNGSYKESFDFIDEHTFVYFDPPYRPLTVTASFTSYSEFEFGDEQQKELCDYFRKITTEKHAMACLSNSDPKNTDQNDDFFDSLYEGFNINRIYATRAINSKGDARGAISELLITNYDKRW